MHFLRPETGHISPHFGLICLLNNTEDMEKGKKHSDGENSKNPMERFPENCRFLSLVVVERVLLKSGRTCPA